MGIDLGKKFAPILISTLVLLYFAMSIVGIIDLPFARLSMMENAGIFFGLAVVVYLAGVMVVTLMERLREIDKEDKDDLSKY